MLTSPCCLGSATTLSTSTTSVTYALAPDLSRLASTRTIANPTTSSAGGGILCSGWNVAPTATAVGALPINPGDYNLQKVALSNTPNSVYEIQCYQNQGTGVSLNSGLCPSLDHCIDRCTLVGPATCQVAYYRKDTGECLLYNGQTALTPAPMIFNVQTARLITAAAPQVIDASYLLAQLPAYNLGLCAGPTFSNYDKTSVTVYNQTGTIRTGSLSSRQDSFRIDCRGNTFGVVASSRVDHIAIAAKFGLTPQNADDCARLCNWQNLATGDNTATGCRTFHWLHTGVCEMYASRPGFTQTTTVNNTVYAAGYGRISASGGEWTAGNVATYKRSLDPYRNEKQSKRGKRSKKPKNFMPVPILDPAPDSLAPHAIIPFNDRP